jgi:hypothetical protein
MFKTKYFLLLWIITCGCVPVMWAQDAAEYTNETVGLSFSYPESWQREENPEKILILSPRWVQNLKGKAAFGIQFTPLNYAKDKTLKEYFTELMRDGAYSHGEPDTVIIAEKKWLHAKVTELEANISGEIFLLKYNNILYVMTIAYQPGESSKRFMPVLERIVQSLKLTEVSGG